VKRSVVTLLALSTFATTTVAHSAPKLVGFVQTFRAGTIVVQKRERQLYYVTGAGQAVRYPRIPPASMRRDRPRLPPFIPGGSPQNPMGVAAMTLSGGELAIHGTNEPNSVGHSVRYGCIRMFNEDIEDLYRRVGIGTSVIVE
jgi:lipoprotein-anchoring transpeptidase ErfK/SrfK